MIAERCAKRDNHSPRHPHCFLLFYFQPFSFASIRWRSQSSNPWRNRRHHANIPTARSAHPSTPRLLTAPYWYGIGMIAVEDSRTGHSMAWNEIHAREFQSTILVLSNLLSFIVMLRLILILCEVHIRDQRSLRGVMRSDVRRRHQGERRA